MIFQDVSWIRSNIDKFSPALRKQALDWYKSYKHVPCFVQKYIKATRRRFRKVSIIVQIDNSQEISTCIGTLAKSSGCKVKHELPLIDSFTAKVNAKTLEKLVTDNSVKRIWFDDTVKAILDVASPVMKAPKIWEGGVTGKGIGVAVIDTGVYEHPDLAGRITGFKDFIGNKTKPYDDNGHGTHVAGDIASDGSQSNFLYRGTAPGADIIGVKVLNSLGSGSLSTVIEGIQWCIENKDILNIRVINMSLGSTAYQSYKEDPVCLAVEKAWKHGIVVCVAAGNEGPEAQTIASPGIDPSVITVGALDDRNSLNFDDYVVANFSSRGPTIEDNLVKPDIVCSGTNIISLRSPNSTIDKQSKGARVGNGYISLSGTSMAAPVCAGIVALMLELNNNLTPDEVKRILMETSRPLPNIIDNIQGKGLVDAEETIKKIKLN